MRDSAVQMWGNDVLEEDTVVTGKNNEVFFLTVWVHFKRSCILYTLIKADKNINISRSRFSSFVYVIARSPLPP